VGEEAARDTTGKGGATDAGHRFHRRRAEVGLGFWGFSVLRAARLKFLEKLEASRVLALSHTSS
jgi:hypothetical protein